MYASSPADLRDTLLAGEDIEAAAPAVVEVVGLSYTLLPTSRKAQARTVLSGVSCAFPPGRLSAIMGASGSGKTSLLTLIRGLSSPGAKMQGDIMCNGQRVDIDLMRSVASAVPQEDVFLSALTPREMLSFAAELRLPSKFTARDRQHRVDQILSVLKLESCASTPTGDERLGIRGISGGERRRLSIGLSIIGGLPPLLLCDEPTSGLDSAAAAGVVSLLKALSQRGVTILCAIHQPSFPVFREFASLLLLEGGRTMYFGSVSGGNGGTGGGAQDGGVEAHFAKFGAPTPEHINPAHHYIQEIQERGPFWAGRWEEVAAGATAATPVAAPHGRRASPASGKSFSSRSPLSLWRQTEILTRRTLLENFKNKKKFFRGIMSRMPASIMIGFFFWRMAVEPTQQKVFPLRGVLFVTIQNPLVDTFYAGASTFQMTKGLLRREYYDGLYQVAPYYLSYYLGFLAMQLPWTLAWALPLYVLVGFPLDAVQVSVFLLTTFLMILMACAAGSAVGTRTKDADGNRAVLMPLMIPMVLFSGYVIPYQQISAFWKPIYFLSPVQWGMSILETNQYRGVTFPDCDPAIPKRFRHCFTTGEELLEASMSDLAQRLGVEGMLLVMVAYICLFLVLNIRAIRTCVLDGSV